MTPSIVASVILMYRKGISKDQLVERCGFVYDEIVARGGNLQVTLRPNMKIIDMALKLLADFLEIKVGIVRPNNHQYEKSIMMLSYYRNNLVHLFINHAEIACAALSLARTDKTISGEETWGKTQFLKSLLNQEFFQRDVLKKQEDFQREVGFLNKQQILAEENGTLKLQQGGEISQMKQAFLSHFVLPYVDTYAVALAFFAIPSNRGQTHDEEFLYSKIQWVLKTLFGEGVLRYFESCMIDTIRTSVAKFTHLGVLSIENVRVKRDTKRYFKVSADYLSENGQKLAQLYGEIVSFSQSPITNFSSL